MAKKVYSAPAVLGKFEVSLNLSIAQSVITPTTKVRTMGQEVESVVDGGAVGSSTTDTWDFQWE